MILGMLCLAAAAVGIDVGWQPLPEGGMVYIIQLEPEALDLLRSGQMLESDIPANVKNVRGYRILVGREKLPQIEPPTASVTETQKPTLGPILADAAGKSLPAEFQTPQGPPAPSAEKPASPAPVSPIPAEPPRPWLPLTLASLLCFALLAAFAYLLWIHLELRGRYRKLLEGSLAVR